MTEKIHLQQFAHQLASWTEAIIEHGRTPFRRVDSYPTIDTEMGIIEPPLVFWINRQSMMAGGVLLLPDDNLDEELMRGCHCAAALGLNHFITWETDRVRIWQCDKEKILEQQTFPLSSPSHLETFRHLLTDILEALKLLAVLGATPSDNLPPCYFSNLFQITLHQTLPPLIATYRSQRSEIAIHSQEDADTCANEANRLLLLQLLALLHHELLTGTIPPEKLEQTIELALPQLPNFLQLSPGYANMPKSPPLPLDVAVCFQHLLLRLRQLSWNQNGERATTSIRRLIDAWYQPEVDTTDKQIPVQLHPQSPPINTVNTITLSRSPALLAATAFMTDRTNSKPGKLLLGQLFQLDQNSLSTLPVYARLVNRCSMTKSERHEYTVRLRAAWPNRHLKIKTGQPCWRWELIHLLGICHAGQSLTLELPLELLNDSENLTAWSLLAENFSVQHLWHLNSNIFKIELIRGGCLIEPFTLERSTEKRVITPYQDRERFRNQLLLALFLPTDIYQLLDNELIWPAANGIAAINLPGWKIFSQSRLYTLLETILRGTNSVPKSTSQTTIESDRVLIPHPAPQLLQELRNGQRTNWATTSLDHFLSQLLNIQNIARIELPETTKTVKPGTFVSPSGKKIREDITRQVTAHGIPNFPEQYLYFLDQPQISHYTITPPLTVKSSLLGQFELEDSSKKIISGYGGELEQILLFCSKAEKTDFDLPSDRHQLEQLLKHYKKDLISLYRHLNDLCYRRIEDPKAARKLIKQIWSNLKLPEPSWFTN